MQSESVTDPTPSKVVVGLVSPRDRSRVRRRTRKSETGDLVNKILLVRSQLEKEARNFGSGEKEDIGRGHLRLQRRHGMYDVPTLFPDEGLLIGLHKCTFIDTN